MAFVRLARLGLCALAASVVAASGTQAATLLYDRNVTPDVIFGSGNDNGSFTVARDFGVELGLRGKQRFPKANVFNSNGDGTYNFDAGVPSPGFGSPPGSSSTALWNFEWSVNVDFGDDSPTTPTLNSFTYLMGIDFDPGLGTNFLQFDPINVAYADHALGDNSTLNGGGTVIDKDAADREAQYAAALASNTVAQNSWNMEFFDTAPVFPFDGNNDGRYEFFLAAFDDQGNQLARTEISIIVGAVGEPGTLAVLGVGIAGVAWLRRRRDQG